MSPEKKTYDLMEDESFRRYVFYGEFAEKWEKWQIDHPEWRQEMQMASLLLKNLNYKNNNIVKDINNKDIKNRIKKILLHNIDHAPAKTIRKYAITGVAAILLVLVILVPLLVRMYDDIMSQEVPKLVNTPETVKENPPGVKSILTFSDGSKVYLNAESKIELPSIFPEDLREATLIGEAYFVINRDENRPFVIHAGGLDVEVLGTSFNVNAYPENPFVHVALVSGKVSVNTQNGEKVVLAPMEMLDYSLADKGSYRVDPFVSENITGWKDGILIFREESISDIFKKLERWYAIDIEYNVNNPVFGDWIFTGKFNNRSLEYILNTMNHQGIFEFTIENDKVIIK